MKTEELYTMIQQKPVILDGATGSNLQKVGMKPGVCPEEWILENEGKLIDLQKSFVFPLLIFIFSLCLFNLFFISNFSQLVLS